MEKIFVFGSNLAGKHLGGAAQDAFFEYGAVMGVGEGPTGLSYAIPTLDATFEQCDLAAIGRSVFRFLDYARQHPEQYFFVTRVGCGIAGFVDEQIAPLFDGASDNCGFDPLWQRFGLPTWREE